MEINMELLQHIIEQVSLVIGLMGVVIIIAGSFKGFYEYIISHHKSFYKVRLTLGSHLILGLDFMVGKDIIDTLLIKNGETFWQDLAALFVIVAVRIILSIMTQKGMEHITKNYKESN